MFAGAMQFPNRTRSHLSVMSPSLFLLFGPALEAMKNMAGLGALSLHVPALVV